MFRWYREGDFYTFNAYFRFRHASVTNGAVVAESGGSIHGSSPFVLGEAAQYRTQGRPSFRGKRQKDDKFDRFVSSSKLYIYQFELIISKIRARF